MKFPVIDFIDIVVDDFKNDHNVNIESLPSVLGYLNKQRFFKTSILPEISIEEYAQIIFGVFFKMKKNYTNEQLEKLFNDITFYIWCSTYYIETKSESCDECYGNGSTTCDMCDRSGQKTCSDCDGSGQVTDEDGNFEECYDCDGSGTVSCNYCDGEGDVYCHNCDGGGVVTGDEYFDYSLYLVAGLTNKSEYNVLRKYEAYNDPKTIDTVNDLKYTVDLYEYSGTLEEGDSLFNSRDITNQSNYFFGLLGDNIKNDKYSNFRIGTIEEYV
jgi:hypothetical protein